MLENSQRFVNDVAMQYKFYIITQTTNKVFVKKL